MPGTWARSVSRELVWRPSCVVLNEWLPNSPALSVHHLSLTLVHHWHCRSEQQMAAVKRLLRDLFSDQLAIKSRLTALEASSEDPAGDLCTVTDLAHSMACIAGTSAQCQHRHASSEHSPCMHVRW
jgi:hypothetical protein